MYHTYQMHKRANELVVEDTVANGGATISLIPLTLFWLWSKEMEFRSFQAPI